MRQNMNASWIQTSGPVLSNLEKQQRNTEFHNARFQIKCTSFFLFTIWQLFVFILAADTLKHLTRLCFAYKKERFTTLRLIVLISKRALRDKDNKEKK